MCTKGILAEQTSYEFKNLVKLETVPMKIQIPICTTVFDFSSKTSFCEGRCAFLGPGFVDKSNNGTHLHYFYS